MIFLTFFPNGNFSSKEHLISPLDTPIFTFPLCMVTKKYKFLSLEILAARFPTKMKIFFDSNPKNWNQMCDFINKNAFVSSFEAISNCWYLQKNYLFLIFENFWNFRILLLINFFWKSLKNALFLLLSWITWTYSRIIKWKMNSLNAGGVW